ncbi:hypothetical protein [Corynebacterium senegalense]|uniref:hypothetical protein n=1 Tax=Corynebacterium senegalense TaxID=2080750 RepID=UPI0011C053AE|nr:hypothetical protein [Corynebacterium senegalense]
MSECHLKRRVNQALQLGSVYGKRELGSLFTAEGCALATLFLRDADVLQKPPRGLVLATSCSGRSLLHQLTRGVNVECLSPLGLCLEGHALKNALAESDGLRVIGTETPEYQPSLIVEVPTALVKRAFAGIPQRASLHARP